MSRNRPEKVSPLDDRGILGDLTQDEHERHGLGRQIAQVARRSIGPCQHSVLASQQRRQGLGVGAAHEEGACGVGVHLDRF
jgi:hypothetical protein